MRATSPTGRLGLALLLASSASAKEAAPRAPDMETKKALYALCLDSEFSTLSRPNLEDANVYPLMELKDEDIGPALKAKCRTWIQARLPAIDAETTTAFDTLDVDMQQDFVLRAQRNRPALSEKLQAIRAKGPRPAIAFAEIVNADDYPPAALRDEDQGTATATYTIGVNGRVSECTATGASDLLNSTFCGIIMRRWRYAPAIDADNRPIPETRTKAVTFGLRTIGGLK